MKELYRFLVDCGADAVINHHQHCFSGYEIYNEKPIFMDSGTSALIHPLTINIAMTRGTMVLW